MDVRNKVARGSVARKCAAAVGAVALGLGMVAVCPADEPAEGQPDQAAVVQAEQSQDVQIAVASIEMEPQEILDVIQADFDDTIAYLEGELEVRMLQVEGSFEEYVANEGLIDDWYDLVNRETELLFDRLSYNTYVYFKSVIAYYDPETQSREIDRARDDFYDSVYDDAFDDYYDAIYDDAFDLIYDDVYGGALDDQPDDVAYKDWSSARSSCYKAWSRNHTKVYKAWSRNHTDTYNDWSDVGSAFWQDDYDIDAAIGTRELPNQEFVRGTVAASTAAGETTEVEEGGEAAEEELVDGMRAGFKAAVDAYVALCDEYYAAAQAYAENPNDLTLLTGCLAVLASSNELLDEVNEWEDDGMNAVEEAYVTQAMFDAAGKITAAGLLVAGA